LAELYSPVSICFTTPGIRTKSMPERNSYEPIMGEPETISTETDLSASTMALAIVRQRLTWPRPNES
jgi:hypothetical protein